MARRSLPALAMGCLLALCLASCDDDATVYPSYIIEMADVATQWDGRVTTMTTDDSLSYPIANELYGKEGNTIYRLLCTYTLDNSTSPATATIYGTTSVWVLTPSEAPEQELDLTVVSAWKGGAYINLRLQYMYRDVQHSITLSQDSVADGITYLRLHHPYVEDYEAWTIDAYASIPWEGLPTNHVVINETYEFTR